MLFYRCSLIEDAPGSQKSIESLLGDVLKAMRLKGRPTEEEMAGFWKTAVGEKAAKHSRPQSLKKGVVTIHVDSSGWLYELTTEKKSIIRSLEGSFKGKKIKDIRFRIGDIK